MGAGSALGSVGGGVTPWGLEFCGDGKAEDCPERSPAPNNRCLGHSVVPVTYTTT